MKSFTNHSALFAVLIVLPFAFPVQAAEGEKVPVVSPPVGIKTPVLGCCQCVSQTEKNPNLDLSTDPTKNNWTVRANGGSATAVAYPTSIHPAWNIIPPAGTKWVSTVATGSTGSVAAGTYIYELKFYVQNCTIPQSFNLSGSAGGDDDYEIYIDDPAINSKPKIAINSPAQAGSCTGGYCFFTPRPTPLSPAIIPPFSQNLTLTPGLHSLIVKIKNYPSASPSGMFINAKLTGNCSTKLVKETVEYPYDRYDNGKLTINAVEVPDVFGGLVKYKASLSLQPQSNPLTFTLDQAEPIPNDPVQQCVNNAESAVPPTDTSSCYQ